MKKLLFSVVVVCLSISSSHQSQELQHNGSYDWDVLIFTQQWPETVCTDWVHHNPSHTCDMPKKVDTWSIHGIWPTKFGTRGPEFCNRTWHFDPEQIRPIESELIDIWTNIEGGTQKYSFWAHEWTKHGTCAAILNDLNSEFKYFSKGLEWKTKYDMTRILASQGIVPNDSKLYSLKDIYNAVKAALGVNPSIQCRKEQGGVSYIGEIRICFDKQLQLHNCDGITKSEDSMLNIVTNCDMTQGILYPHNKVPMSKIYVELYKLVSWLEWLTL